MSFYGSVSIKVDVDVQDVIDELSHTEREELYEELKEEFGSVEPAEPEIESEDLPGAKTQMDHELRAWLLELWQNRDYFTPSQRARIERLTKENFIEK